MTVVEIPSRAPASTHAAQRWLGGRFRLDERISSGRSGQRVLGPRGSSWEARGLSLWKASDQLLGRPVTIYLLPPGIPVPRPVIEAVQSAAKVTDPRLAAIYDTDFNPECPYIVSEWTPGTPLEDLVLSGLPHPALAAAMIADAADALAIAHQAGRPHLRLTPRSLRWDPGSGLKITGLGLDAALCGATADNPRAADTMALARMLYALLTGYWPGDEATAQSTAQLHRTAAGSPAQGPRVHAAAGPGRGARPPGRHHLPRAARPGRGRPAAGADSGRAGHGASHGAAAVLPAGKAEEAVAPPVRAPAERRPDGTRGHARSRLAAPDHACCVTLRYAAIGPHRA